MPATVHDRAAILAVGDELVLGQALDTNSRWISARLLESGVPVVEHATTPDDAEAQAAAILRLAAAAPLLIVTGGLGPTADDLTRSALAAAMGEPLVEDAGLLAQIQAYFADRGVEMPANNRLQALRPAGAAGIANPNGTAPGLRAAVAIGGVMCDVFCLPGPPGEMKPMFEAAVAPLLRPPSGRIVRTLVLHTFGLGESVIAERLGPLMDRARNPLVGTTASEGVISCRIRFQGDARRAESAVRSTEGEVRAALGPIIFGEGDPPQGTLAAAALRELERRHERLVVVESCTGGMLGSMIADVPGASRTFLGGWITYSNELKESEVRVPGAVLKDHGAVSAETAQAMAEGALRAPAGAAAAHALAITGVAGPDGGSASKPVGTVFIALRSRAGATTECEVRRFAFSGDRGGIRRRSAMSALAMLRFRLIGARVERLPREEAP